MSSIITAPEDIKGLSKAEIKKKIIEALTPKEISPREIEEAKKRMEWLIGFMIIRYQFVYQILGMMTKTCIPHFPTMGVRVLGGGNFNLCYGVEFVNSLKDEELTYVMYHETLHLALHHCTTRKFDLHEIGNIADDLAVNEIVPIEAGSCVPPAMGTFVSDFKKKPMFADIKEKQTAEWYYDFLREKMKDQDKGKGKGEGEGQGEGQGNGEGDGQGDGQDQSQKGKGQGQDKDQNKADQGKGFDNHDGWAEDEVADEKVRAKINEIAKSDSWGNVGGTERELILAAQVRRVNWRNILRQFYGNMVWHERESTRKRPNRRTGLIHPGNRKIQVDRHLVVADTSGSVGSDLAGQFLATVNQMTEYVPIDFAQCDCGITEQPRPFNSKKKEVHFSGRGGTDFQPIMDLVNEKHYKSVVILTDGQASECTQPKARVVWVLPEGCNPPVEWGQRIHMVRHV